MASSRAPSRLTLAHALPRPALNTQRVDQRYAGRWLAFEELTFTDPVAHQERRWEYVQRIKRGGTEQVALADGGGNGADNDEESVDGRP